MLRRLILPLAALALAATALLSGVPDGPISEAGGTADLSISTTDSPDPVIAGEKLLYTVWVDNNGLNDATNVTVVDTLPLEVHYLTDNAGCTFSAGTGPGGEDQLTCNLGGLDSGDSAHFDIMVDVDSGVLRAEPHESAAAGVISNTAEVSADQTDPDDSDNTDVETTFIQESADLRILKFAKDDNGQSDTGTPDLHAGEQMTMTIIVDNLGPSAARNLVIRDTLVTGNFFDANGCSLAVRTEGGLADEFDCNFALATGVFDLGTFGANWLNPRSTHDTDGDDFPDEFGRIIITINGTADRATQVNNLVTVESDTPDPDTSNNLATTFIEFLPPKEPPVVSPLPAAPKAAWGVPIEFHGFATDPNGAPQDTLKYFWEFGDGTTALNPKVSHAYDKPGQYTVNLRVTDVDGEFTEVSTEVTVNKRATGLKNCGPVQVQERDKFQLCARLIDLHTHKGIKGRTVEFAVTGKEGEQGTIGGVTDANGEVRLSFPIRLDQDCNPVSISYDGTSDNLYDSSDFDYILSTRGCAVGTVAGYDANADGVLDATDATLILQLEAGLIGSPAGASPAYTSIDATLVLQYVAELIDSLPMR